ncbi:TRAP transporter large permease [Elioraea sp.]|uniref:TRAP transporter large permease n=1 Tax=Elioraea sp. TaxID=2185103 RepID=UPI0025C1A461|nr:TRAP transporter large permease subunit [Elioraea sp.]
MLTQSLLVVMCTLFLLGVPIAVSIGLAAIFGIQVLGAINPVIIGQQLYVVLDKFPLVAIPFFILAGNLMDTGGISRRLIDVARAMVGRTQGGLAATCVVACMIFAAVSGSSTATTFAIGAIMIPALERAGYPKPWAAALQATSAELGVIIPPSIPLILFGVAADVSIGELFIAGFGPGLLIGFVLIGYVLVWARLTGHGKADALEGVSPLPAFRRATFALLMPVVVLGGIYGGVFTPTEASAIAVVYALAIGMFVHRELGWRDLGPVLRKSVISSVVILFIIAWAGLFAFIINREGVPAAIGAWMLTVIDSPVTFLLVVNLVLFVIGMFIEGSAAIIVLAPILVPVAIRYGIDPVHFGIVMVVNLAIGFITPPFGVNLFAACAVARIPLQRIVKPIVAFIGVVLACLLLITYIPPIPLALRDWVYR